MEILQAKIEYYIRIKFCYLHFSIIPVTARLYFWRKNVCSYLCLL